LKQIRLLSWNVNGVRAALKKGFIDWLDETSPDIIGLQETKAHPEQLTAALLEPAGYHTYWNYPERKGYSGVAVFSREEPRSVAYEFAGVDIEGRIIVAEYPGFVLCNGYFPNGSRDEERLRYKLDFYERFLEFIDGLKARGKKIIICGDINTAHNEIDLARPKENANNSGFLRIERDWLDKLTAHGYVDSFRHFNSEPGHYTWWDMKTRARERNVGWRLDYFFVSDNILPAVTGAYIMPDVTGSDHCPVGLTLSLAE
jgi:exodeoxyribonuclease III